MKRLAIVLIAFMILVAGCAKETPAPTPIEQPEQQVAEKPVETVSEFGLKTFNLNSPQTIAGKVITVNDIDPTTGQIRLTIDSTDIVLSGTKEHEIALGLDLVVDNFKSYGREDPRTYVAINVQEFKLGPNEYLLRKDQPQTISGSTIKLIRTGMTDTGIRFATFDINGQEQRVMQDETFSSDNLKLTNLKTFFRSQSYAVVKIVIA